MIFLFCCLKWVNSCYLISSWSCQWCHILFILYFPHTPERPTCHACVFQCQWYWYAITTHLAIVMLKFTWKFYKSSALMYGSFLFFYYRWRQNSEKIWPLCIITPSPPQPLLTNTNILHICFGFTDCTTYPTILDTDVYVISQQSRLDNQFIHGDSFLLYCNDTISTPMIWFTFCWDSRWYPDPAQRFCYSMLMLSHANITNILPFTYEASSVDAWLRQTDICRAMWALRWYTPNPWLGRYCI